MCERLDWGHDVAGIPGCAQPEPQGWAAGLGVYQVGGLWIGRAAGWLTEVGSGGVVVAFAVGAWGEEAFDDAFESRYTFGKHLHVFTHVGQAGVDFRSQSLIVRAEFGSQGLAVSAHLSSERRHVSAQQADHCGGNADQGGADGEDSDEFGGDGRLLRVDRMRDAWPPVLVQP